MNENSKVEPAWELRRIPLAVITVDPSIQQRVAGTSQEVVEDYAEAMRDGDEFPVPVVFSNDDGVTGIVGDGFHRLEAYRLAHPDAQEIVCELRSGDREDAMIWACGANTRHGLRRSGLDKLKAVTTLLSIDKCSSWSDRQVARQVGLSHPFVAKVRREHLEKLRDTGPHLEMFPDGSQRKGGHSASALPVPYKRVPAATQDRRRTVTRRGQSYSMRIAGMGVSRTTPGRPQDAGAMPPLTSLAWSMADKQVRVKFVSAVGGHEILEVLKLISPGFDILDWAWKVAGAAERQSFAKSHLVEINSFAEAAGLKAATQAGCPAFAKEHIDEPHSIAARPAATAGPEAFVKATADPPPMPSFLKRGHPDCVVHGPRFVGLRTDPKTCVAAPSIARSDRSATDLLDTNSFTGAPVTRETDDVG